MSGTSYIMSRRIIINHWRVVHIRISIPRLSTLNCFRHYRISLDKPAQRQIKPARVIPVQVQPSLESLSGILLRRLRLGHSYQTTENSIKERALNNRSAALLCFVLILALAPVNRPHGCGSSPSPRPASQWIIGEYPQRDDRLPFNPCCSLYAGFCKATITKTTVAISKLSGVHTPFFEPQLAYRMARRYPCFSLFL